MLTLLGCADPALKPMARAREAWGEGVAALERQAPEEAAARFAAARADDAQSPELALWEAKALADAGRLAEADAVLAGLLRTRPDEGIAWYNRAAYACRAGRFEAAAPWLEQAMRLGVRSRLEAAADPDFAAALANPAFATVLPPAPLLVTGSGPEGAVLVGSRFDIELRVSALSASRLTLRREGADPGCLRLVRVVEDDRAIEGGVERRLRLGFRGDGPCAGELGPFVVAAGPSTGATQPFPITVEALDGASVPVPALPVALPVPGQAEAGPWEGDVDAELEWRVDGATTRKGRWTDGRIGWGG